MLLSSLNTTKANLFRIEVLHLMQKDRPTKAVVLKDKSVVMLYNVDGDVYCSDANSTAFQYPLTHAKIVKGMSRAGIASPWL